MGEVGMNFLATPPLSEVPPPQANISQQPAFTTWQMVNKGLQVSIMGRLDDLETL